MSAPPPDCGRVVLEDLREAEVDHLHEVAARAQRLEDDVLRLEVAVDDAERVRLLERRERLAQDVDDAPERQRAPRRAATRAEVLPRRYSMTM